MVRSYTSSVNSSVSPKEPEVTFDDVAEVIAGLNNKVLDLRRAILALKDSSGSEETNGRAGYVSEERIGRNLTGSRSSRRKSSPSWTGSPPKNRTSSPFTVEFPARENYSTRRSHPRARRRSVYSQESELHRKPRSRSESADRINVSRIKNSSRDYRVEKVDPRLRNVNKNSRGSGDQVRRKSLQNHDISAECQGIRHALGLSTGYCDCNPTGSPVRRVRRKRISRGTQYDPSVGKKKKFLGGCFAFGCCAKPKKSKRRKSEKIKSPESPDVYRPANRSSKIDARQSKDLSRTRESKIEKKNSVTPNNENFRENRRRALNNDVENVEKRLNECLVQLNGIVSDIGYAFEEKNHKFKKQM